MRILHVLHSLDQRYGGPVRAVLDLSARAIPLGLDAEVLGFGPISIEDNPFPLSLIHWLPIEFPSAYLYSRGLKPWLRKNLQRFDGVILHGMWLYPNWATVEACTRESVPYICFPHGMLEPWAFYGQGLLKTIKKTLYWRLVERRIVHFAAATFFTTDRERSLARSIYSPKGATMIVVPYGVDRCRLLAPVPDRPELQVLKDRRVALFLGRVHPKKNVDLLIEAWAQAKPAPEWLLLIAGPCTSKHQRELDRLVERHRLGDQIQFTGSVAGTDKSYLLGRASWFLLPSKQENFGISVLEAISAGCPVAISDQVFLADYFHKGSEILPLRLEAWVDFIRNRMSDEQHRQELIRLDGEFVVPQFAMDNIVRRWALSITDVFQKENLKH